MLGAVLKELSYSDVLPCRLHHTLTTLNDQTVFVFGGRLSPAKPFSDSTLLRFTRDDEGKLMIRVSTEEELVCCKSKYIVKVSVEVEQVCIKGMCMRRVHALYEEFCSNSKYSTEEG